MVDTLTQSVIPSLTAKQATAVQEQFNRTLLDIIRGNFNTQYASQVDLLAGFRDAVSAHGGTGDDVALLADFRSHVPFSSYIAYKPFIDRFEARPCKKEEVQDLLSPGLPDLLGVSSATSGTRPKILPKYNHFTNRARRFFDPKRNTPLAGLICTDYRDVKEIGRAPGEVEHRIPVCIMTGGALRRSLEWYIDDDNRLYLPVPGYAVPWAATVIGYISSFLTIHGLFFLARRDLEQFYVPFGTLFVDLIRRIDEHWDLLVSCIRDGTVPDLQGIAHVRAHLQTHLVADPGRAAELLGIGPPFSREGWFTSVWPNASLLTTICSGTFSIVLPKLRSIVGPTVDIRAPGYGATESALGLPHGNKLDEFVLRPDETIEFLDVTQEETHENLRQAVRVHHLLSGLKCSMQRRFSGKWKWGKQYELALTTRDGLWRYRLGDVVDIIGFDSKSNTPVFKYSGRRGLTLRFPHTQITDAQLISAVKALITENMVHVAEFTTVIDDRAFPSTVRFFVELAQPLVRPDPQKVSQCLFEALVATNIEHRRAHQNGQMGLPTIRIVKAGTFAEYRWWKGESANIASGQIKVPVVLLQPSAQAWILERVTQEM
ncbi:GH3 auxin-responsive promoter [Chiua virens]|nr:GH3 auxin-responsive promoter [Chiua virens]